jgi:hypothetical protein
LPEDDCQPVDTSALPVRHPSAGRTSGPGRAKPGRPVRPPRRPRDLLAEKGFNGRAFAAAQAERGTDVLVPPWKKERAAMPSVLLKVIAEWRSRIETTSTRSPTGWNWPGMPCRKLLTEF